MKVTITKAAKLAGVTRGTFYTHIEKKGITVEKDEEGKPRIDVSELIRVYGDNIKIPDTSVVQAEQHQTLHQTQGNAPSMLIDSKNNEIKRLVEEKDALRRDLEYQKEQTNKVMMLIENHSKKEDGEGEEKWLKALKSLETRIVNQEKIAKEKAEADSLEKTALKKQLVAKEKLMEEKEQALKDAELKRKEEEYEASQTWVSKMFGKKNSA